MEIVSIFNGPWGESVGLDQNSRGTKVRKIRRGHHPEERLAGSDGWVDTYVVEFENNWRLLLPAWQYGIEERPDPETFYG